MTMLKTGFKKWLGSEFRKLLFWAAGALIAKMIAAGIFNEADIDRFVVVVVAGLILVVTSLWSSVILPWIKKILNEEEVKIKRVNQENKQAK